MKLTYEQEKKLREMKEFRFSLGICAIISWILTIVISLTEGFKADEKFLIPFGGIVVTILFLYMSKLINQIEKYKQIN